MTLGPGVTELVTRRRGKPVERLGELVGTQTHLHGAAAQVHLRGVVADLLDLQVDVVEGDRRSAEHPVGRRHARPVESLVQRLPHLVGAAALGRVDHAERGHRILILGRREDLAHRLLRIVGAGGGGEEDLPHREAAQAQRHQREDETDPDTGPPAACRRHRLLVEHPDGVAGRRSAGRGRHRRLGRRGERRHGCWARRGGERRHGCCAGRRRCPAVAAICVVRLPRVPAHGAESHDCRLLLGSTQNAAAPSTTPDMPSQGP